MKILYNLEFQIWDEFVNCHPKGNIFQSSYMIEIYSRTEKYKPISLAVADENEKIMGVLLGVIQKEHKGLIGFLSARSIIIGGPLVKDNNLEVLDFILGEYIKKIKNQVIYSQYRNMWLWSEDEKSIFNQNGFDYESHLNILIDLKQSKDELWKDLKKNRREGIKKAERNNLRFEYSNSIDILPNFYNLLKESYTRIKLPYPDIDFFENILEILPQEKVKFFVMKKDTKIIISLLAFIFRERLYAFYIGTDSHDDILKLRPVDLFYWEVMKWGAENNIEIYDWMGAGKPNVDYGVRQFKLQFGGVLVEHGRFLFIHNSFLYKLGKMGLKLLTK